MKKRDWLLLAIFGAAAVGLRAGQMLTGFDEAGLPLRGNLCGLLLVAVLVAAAVYFVLAMRDLSAKRGERGGLAACFRFSGNPVAAAGVVGGAFLLLASAGATLMGYGLLRMVPLTVLTVASAMCLLYMVFALCRGAELRGTLTLVPVCSLVIYLILLYRVDASDPVLAHIYVELLAVAALTYAALELSAFAFANGSPRIFLPAGAMAALLALATAAERQNPASVLLFAGCALIALGFLRAARPEG